LTTLARSLWLRLLEKSSPNVTCGLKNLVAAAKGKAIRFGYDPETALFRHSPPSPKATAQLEFL
jgi:hypothetical protein